MKLKYLILFCFILINICSFGQNTKMTIHGYIENDKTKQKLAAPIIIYDDSSNIKLFEIAADTSKGYYFQLESKRKYMLTIQLEDYLFYSELIDLRKDFENIDKTKNIELQEIIKSTDPFHISFILFEKNKSEILASDSSFVFKLVDFLKSNKKIKMEIAGHCDADEAQNKNILIDEIRAKKVYDLIVLNDIDKARLVYKGYRDTHPIDSNEIDEGMKNNRRVEFSIISNN